MEIIYKKIGETPLECMRRIKGDSGYTYAGRLDPLAEGLLIILKGDEDKDKYLELDKEYEYSGVLGIHTDTYDVLGKITKVEVTKDIELPTGKRTMKYPIYSSKTVKGIPLFEYARKGIDVEIPERDVEIYENKLISKEEITGNEIANVAIDNIRKVKGDFRQDEIIQGWEDFRKEYKGKTFILFKARAKVSSGTYIRGIVEEVGGVTFSIKRTKIGEFTANNF